MLLQWQSRVIWIWVIVLYTWQWVEDKTVICFSFWLLTSGETVTDHLFPTLPVPPTPANTCLTFLNTSMNLFGSPLPFFPFSPAGFVAFFSTHSQQKWIYKSIFAFSITLLISHFVFPSNVPISFSLSFLLQKSYWKSCFIFFFIFCHSMLIGHTRLESFWNYFKYPSR